MPSKILSVFHVYKKVARYPKRAYKALDKHSLRKHPNIIQSKAGADESAEIAVQAGRPIKLFEKSNTVIITDFIPNDEKLYEPETKIAFLNLTENPAPFEIFTIRKNNNSYELWLNYSENEQLIGEPHRDDFYLLNFEKDEPIQVIINGINDTNEEGRYQRIYNEHVYVIHYAGEQSVKSVKKLSGVFKREIPFKETKMINLRRLFY